MDDGEIELSDHLSLPNSVSPSIFEASMAGDPCLDDLLRNAQTCTHTHTCNIPPGPDATHTHTCYHTHTQLIPSEDGEAPGSPARKPQRASGNRVAVRKYREKKKAREAYLEEEVRRLTSVNKVLMGKIQRRGNLEAEILRLRGLLVELRGKIDSGLGDFQFEKRCPGVGYCQRANADREANVRYFEGGDQCLRD